MRTVNGILYLDTMEDVVKFIIERWISESFNGFPIKCCSHIMQNEKTWPITQDKDNEVYGAASLFLESATEISIDDVEYQVSNRRFSCINVVIDPPSSDFKKGALQLRQDEGFTNRWMDAKSHWMGIVMDEALPTCHNNPQETHEDALLRRIRSIIKINPEIDFTKTFKKGTPEFDCFIRGLYLTKL